MTKRMLIDASHAEETRVVVLDGNRLEDFDVETATKKQLKGNIYLAKIVRVEPSLQAAFVEYGGGRHGFLAFGEIHPDYYQIPVADRQRLLEMQAEEAREEEEAEEAAERAQARHHGGQSHGGTASAPDVSDQGTDDSTEASAIADQTLEASEQVGDAGEDASQGDAPTEQTNFAEQGAPHDADHPPVAAAETHDGPQADEAESDDIQGRPAQAAAIVQDMRFGDFDIVPASQDMHIPGAGGLEDALAEADAAAPGPESAGEAGLDERGILSDDDIETPDPDAPPSDVPPPETIGGETDTYDGAAEARARRASRLLRNYRIQEVIRRRQIMLIQVVKEERGTKGAALTTYISLAGRYCVLMPNSPRGGGISRKITSASDRRRLKEITAELEIPRGMGLIVRTAGAARPKPEIKRDCEYLMRLWDDIRDHTLISVAPALIYEEASLIKRAIRDVYSRDVEEVLVDGEQGWRAAHDFMRMLMPSHARKVQLWRSNGAGATQPLFSANGVESQLDGMLSPTVQLRSGGYLVFAQTEALVSIDVNSGRSTRERGIEETAIKTNLEAADEVARQLRLRDLAGLIVIDFIDMESRKNNAAVERRMKDALKNDRARIQVGHISHFGLLEMSRQRLRPSLAETAFITCSHCGGAGHVRSIESAAIHVLRQIEEEGGKQKAAQIMVHCDSAVTLYLLNHKRDRLGEIEARYAMAVHFTPDHSLVPPEIRIDRMLPQVPEAERRVFAPVIPAAPAFAAETEEEFEEQDDVADEGDSSPDMMAGAPVAPAGETEEEAGRRRRRRRRRGGRRDQTGALASGDVGIDESASDEDARGEAEFDESSPADEIAGAIVEAAPTEVVAVLLDDSAETAAATGQPAIDPTEFDENGLPQPRGPRRSRRGGRRRRRFEPGEAGEAAADAPATTADYVAAAYSGPTPANPFGDQAFDIFDLMDQPLDIPPVPANATAPVDVVPHVEPPVDVASHAEPTADPTDIGSPDHLNEAAVIAAPAFEAEADIEPHPVAVVLSQSGEDRETVATVSDEIHVGDANRVIAEASTTALEPPTPSPEPAPEAIETAKRHLEERASEPPLGEPEHKSAEVDAAPDPSVVQPVVIDGTSAPGGGKRGWWRR